LSVEGGKLLNGWARNRGVNVVNYVYKKYVSFITPLHNAVQNHSIKRSNRRFENVAQLTYVWAAVTDQNFIQEAIKEI
jgi:hypothetical protein